MLRPARTIDRSARQQPGMWLKPISLAVTVVLATTMLATPASARKLRVRLDPWQTEKSDPQPAMTVAQNNDGASAGVLLRGIVPPASAPPAMVVQPPVTNRATERAANTATRSDGSDPLSARAAAAADRASRALAEEQGVSLDDGTTGQTELVPAEESAPVGQPVTSANTQRASAALRPQEAPEKRSPACVAGCY